MESLGDKLVHLSLDIDDRKKSAELLRQLIIDQNSRHENERTKYEDEQDAFLQKITSESSDHQDVISRTTGSLIDRKKALESQIDELLAKKNEAEHAKKKNLDAVRREIAETKDTAHKAHSEERCQREKEWYDQRVAAIHKMTLKGIQPNVDRITRRHKEQCNEIKSRTEYSKQKLELQSENDLTERIQAFQRNEQQSNNCINQRRDFANVLLREQNEHTMRVANLKEKLMKEEESTKKMYALQLSPRRNIALSKIQSSKPVHTLTQELSVKRDSKRQELEVKLERIGKENSSNKAQWEISWMEASEKRIEKKNKQKMTDLLQWRKAEIDSLIRKNLMNGVDCKTPEDAESRLTALHEDNVAALQEILTKQFAAAEEGKANISTVASRKSQLVGNIKGLEDDLSVIESKLNDATNRLDQMRRQHKLHVSEATDSIDSSLQSISERRTHIEREIVDLRERLSKELSNHRDNKDQVMQNHETKLLELQDYASQSAKEIDDKRATVLNSIREQQAYLSRAANLLTTRYKVKK